MDTLFSQFLDETGKKTLWLTVALCVKQVAKKSQLSPLPNWTSSLSSPQAIGPIGRWLESDGQINPYDPVNPVIKKILKIGKILHHKLHAEHCPMWQAEQEVYGKET